MRGKIDTKTDLNVTFQSRRAQVRLHAPLSEKTARGLGVYLEYTRFRELVWCPNWAGFLGTGDCVISSTQMDCLHLHSDSRRGLFRIFCDFEQVHQKTIFGATRPYRFHSKHDVTPGSTEQQNGYPKGA